MTVGKDFEAVYMRLMRTYIESNPEISPEEMLGLSRACFKFGADLHLEANRRMLRLTCCEPFTIEAVNSGPSGKILRSGKWVTGELNHNTLD